MALLPKTLLKEFSKIMATIQSILFYNSDNSNFKRKNLESFVLQVGRKLKIIATLKNPEYMITIFIFLIRISQGEIIFKMPSEHGRQ